MKRKLLLNTGSSLLMQLVTLVCGFILPRLILEQYGSEVNGLTQSIKQFLGVITLLELGVGQVIQSSLYRPLANRDSAGISRIMASGGKFFRRIGYALFAYVIVLMVAYPRIVEQNFGWMYTAALIAAMSINSIVQYLFGVTDNLLLNADQRGYVQYTTQIASSLVNVVVCVAAIRAGLSIHMVKLLSALVYLSKPIAVRLYIRRHYAIDRRIAYTGEPIRQKWNGIAQHISAMVLAGTDTIVLTLFAGLADVSIYSVYFLVIGGIQQFYQAATAGLQSMVGALWAREDHTELHRVFSGIEAALHYVTVFLFACVGILIVPFVRVYTDGLTDADYIRPVFAAVLTLAYWIRCLRTPYNILILAGGHYKQTQRCHVTAAAINLVLSVVTVKLWGLVGVAVGTLAALAYQTVWMVVYDSKNLLRWPLGKVIRRLGLDALAFGLIFLGTRWVSLGEVSYWGWLRMAVPVGLVALGATVLTAAVFDRDLIKIVTGRLAGRGAGK